MTIETNVKEYSTWIFIVCAAVNAIYVWTGKLFSFNADNSKYISIAAVAVMGYIYHLLHKAAVQAKSDKEAKVKEETKKTYEDGSPFDITEEEQK